MGREKGENKKAGVREKERRQKERGVGNQGEKGEKEEGRRKMKAMYKQSAVKC